MRVNGLQVSHWELVRVDKQDAKEAGVDMDSQRPETLYSESKLKHLYSLR